MSGAPDTVTADLRRASALCDLHRYGDAAAALAEIIAGHPESSQAWCLRSLAELGLEQPDPALRAAQTAMALAPDDEWPHRLASIALARLGRPQEAAGRARDAVRLDPHEWRAHAHLARTLAAQRGDLAEAGAAAERALALAPHEVDAHLSAGAVAAAGNRRPEAEAAYRTALSIDPQSSAAHNELARLHLGRRNPANPGRLADAASGFASAVRADPRATVSRHNFDLVLRAFLSRVAYFIFLDAWLVTRIAAGSDQLAARLIPVAALGVPFAFASRFLVRVEPALRPHVLDLLRRDRKTQLAAGLGALAVACLAAASFATGADRPGLAAAAAAAGLGGRLILIAQSQRSSRAARGLPLHAAASPAFLWLVAAALGLAAAALLYASATAGGGAGGILVGVVFGAAAAGIVWRIRRRRAPG